MDRTEAARLAQLFGPAVYRLSYARTGSAADAEDVMQDVFLRLLTKAPRFADDDHAKAWLFKVTINRSRDLFRSPQRHVLPLEAAPDRVEGRDPLPGETLEAVLTLPAKLRTAVHLFYYEELSVEEIAHLLGITPGAVKTRLSRARGRLRQILLEGERDHASG